MIKLKVKNYNTISTEKEQKQQHYHQVKLINTNILQVKKYCRLIKTTNHLIQFTFSPLGKAFEKQLKTIEEQGKNQVEALKALKPDEKDKTKISSRSFSKSDEK